MLRPLTRLRTDGCVYERRAETTALLQDLVGLDRDAILARLAVVSRRDPDYVPSECLVYLLREARRDNRPEWFNQLFAVLDCRLRHNLAHAIKYGSVADAETVREDVLGRFRVILALGLGPEPERLDPFEVVFDRAFAALRKDMYGAQRRRDLRKADLNLDHGDEEGRPSGAEDPYRQPEPDAGFGMSPAEFELFRNQALGSIDRLPEDVRQAVTLFLQGHKIDSKDPDEMTIARQCAVTEKTVRNRIKRGVDLMRAALERAGP